MDIPSFPLRIDETGNFAYVEQGSVEYYRQQLAVLMMTSPEEREMVPDLGVAGLAFTPFTRTLLEQQVAQYLPNIRIADAQTVFESNGVQQVRLTFTGVDE